MIIDASVAFKWIFVEDGSEAASALLGRDDLLAPNLLLAEIGNALWKKGMRGELGDADAYAVQLAITRSLVTIADEGEVMPRALEMALDLEHPIYDCVYLALAESLDDVLITADTRFGRKVASSRFSDRLKLL